MERLDAELQVDMREFPHLRPKTTSNVSAVPNDLQLLSGAMSKVAKLEKDLAHANRRAQKAELELQFVNRSAHAQFHEPFYLAENKRLKTQLAEMEQFLADYGLIWVGANEEEEEDETGSDQSTWQATDGEENMDQKAEQIDWAKIAENVLELNILGGEGRSAIGAKDGATRLVPGGETVRLTLYADGIMLGEGPFRPIRRARHFIDDIADGYFPSELQSRYPEGVVFDLHDHHTQPYRRKFPGIGKSLKTESALPVIKTDDPRLIETDVSRQMSETNASLEDISSRPGSSLSRIPTAKAITLRVRSAEGATHVIRMRSSETVANLRNYIAAELDHSHFRILSLTERGWRPIEDESKSLKEIGLGPRAALQLAPISPKYEDLSQHIVNLKT